MHLGYLINSTETKVPVVWQLLTFIWCRYNYVVNVDSIMIMEWGVR